MRVRILFMLCVSALAVIIAAAATMFVAQGWRDYSNASEAAHLTSATTAVLQTTEQLAVARGPQNAALIADDAASPAALAAVAKARKLVGDNLAGARAAISAANYPERDKALAGLDKLSRDLTESYGNLDRAYQVPRAARDAAFIKDYVPRMLALNTLLEGVAKARR